MHNYLINLIFILLSFSLISMEKTELQLQQQEMISYNPSASRNFENIALLVHHFHENNKLKNTIVARGQENFKRILNQVKTRSFSTIIILQMNPEAEHINAVYIDKKQVMVFEPIGVDSNGKGYELISNIIDAIIPIFDDRKIYVNQDSIQYGKTECGFTSLLFALKLEEKISNFIHNIIIEHNNINKSLIPSLKKPKLYYLPYGSMDPEIKKYTQSLTDLNKFMACRQVNLDFIVFLCQNIKFSNRQYRNLALNNLIELEFIPIVKDQRKIYKNNKIELVIKESQDIDKMLHVEDEDLL